MFYYNEICGWDIKTKALGNRSLFTNRNFGRIIMLEDHTVHRNLKNNYSQTHEIDVCQCSLFMSMWVYATIFIRVYGSSINISMCIFNIHWGKRRRTGFLKQTRSFVTDFY